MRQWRRHHSSGRLVNRSFAHHVLFNGYSIPPGVQGTEFIKGYADVLKSESCAKLLKLSDKVTLTRAFTARWKNRPVIVFFHRVSPIPFF